MIPATTILPTTVAARLYNHLSPSESDLIQSDNKGGLESVFFGQSFTFLKSVRTGAFVQAVAPKELSSSFAMLAALGEK
jgi:hypothetical protein